MTINLDIGTKMLTRNFAVVNHARESINDRFPFGEFVHAKRKFALKSWKNPTPKLAAIEDFHPTTISETTRCELGFAMGGKEA